MSTFEFLNILTDNYILFILCVIPCTLAYVLIANRFGKSWLNPLNFNLFTAGIGIGVALFLFCMGEAVSSSFMYVIISSIIFWGILWFFFPRNTHNFKLKIKEEFLFSRKLFLSLYFGNIILQLLTYYLFGIPLFNDNSRLATFTGSGGFGIISRITPFLSIYSIFYLYNKYIGAHSIKWFKLLLWLSPQIIFGVLSGSRSSFLVFIFSFWGYNKFYKDKEILLSNFKVLLIPFLIISLFTFAIEHQTNVIGGALAFLERVAACGDLYWYALPNDTWADVTVKTPFKDLLVGFLGPLRILSESQTDVPIGYQLTQLVYTDFDKMTGPVELFPVSSLVYFGFYGGIIMVIFQAFFACFFYKLFYRKSDSLIFSALLFFSFFKIVDFIGSLRNATGQLFDILLNWGFVFILCLILALLNILFHPLKNKH